MPAASGKATQAYTTAECGKSGGFPGQVKKWFDGRCFPAGTLVSAEHGPALIETLIVGDLVWAYDPVELV